jgi:pimeloyl-ACP methyl ester carboxylesterase
MRRMIDFACAGDQLVGTLDEGQSTTGLLIVSGGNEIRSGAYAGQAMMAGLFATMDIPVFRYDRRGIGESEGLNNGFESSADDIAAAVSAFRAAAAQVTRIVAFGNCDAASALALYHDGLELDALILANPWVIESTASDDSPTPPAILGPDQKSAQPARPVDRQDQCEEARWWPGSRHPKIGSQWLGRSDSRSFTRHRHTDQNPDRTARYNGDGVYGGMELPCLCFPATAQHCIPRDYRLSLAQLC